MNDPLIGRHLAGYRVERLLGRGGMASIYFAWDTSDDRPVALKVLDERHRDAPAYVQRFIVEAQTIASWQHPNIVQVYSAGEEQGIYFYAMEFIRGLDLAQLLRQYLDASQLLPYAEVLRIGWAVAAALDFAHQRGIIHRDVKPSNVLISVDGRVVLSDFGLVMDVSRGTLGETFGSPHYIAPEQARNSAGAVPQSDIYSLAVMLYEMLTGATPFDDPSPTTLALKHLTEPPPSPRSLNPRLSQAVEAVLLRGLRKNPSERYASGRELMSALDRSLSIEANGQDITVPLPLPPETTRFKAWRSQSQPAPLSIPAVPPASPPPQQDYAQNMQRTGSPPRSPASGPASAGPAPGGSGSAPAAQTRPGVYPSGPPPSASPPAGSRRRWGIGCGAGLAAALLLLLVVFGAVLALTNGSGLFPPLNPSRTDTPDAVAGQPSATVALTPTFTPSLTFTMTPEATGTPEPTQTFQPSATATLLPTETLIPPTETLPPPTETVPPSPTPFSQFSIVHIRDRGIVFVNTGNVPLLLPAFEIWDNDIELEGEEWEVEELQPDQCVLAWERDGNPQLPDDLECEIVGEIVERQGRMKFWTRTMNIRYNDEKIAECRTRDEICEIELP